MLFSCGCGEIGRHARFRFWYESVQVQVLSSAPSQKDSPCCFILQHGECLYIVIAAVFCSYTFFVMFRLPSTVFIIFAHFLAKVG